MAFERITPGTHEWDAYYGNHICRYAFAADLLAGRPHARVLDAACGVGYGARALAEALPGARVVAVDRDEAALAVARGQFAHDRVTVLADDCYTLAAAATHGPYDAVVSFETLEHLAEPARFLSAVRGVLAPGGTLVVSTPNQSVTGFETPDDWSFHEKEYTAAELTALLAGHGFDAADLFGQRVTPIGQLRSEVRGELHALASNPLARVGSAVQRVLRRHPRRAVLPEQPSDFEVAPTTGAACAAEGDRGPFVLIAVAQR